MTTKVLDTVLHADRSLAQRLERAEGLSNAEFVDGRAKAFPDAGCQWIEVAGALAMFDGPESPCTQTFGLGMVGPVSVADLETIERFFRDRGADVFHEVSPLADPSLIGLLNGRGYHPLEMSTVLVRPITPGLKLLGNRNKALRARRIEASEHDMWARVGADGWADSAPGLEDFLLSVGKVNPHRPNCHSFLVETEGTAIAAGGICLIDEIAVMAGACTLPAWRRLGAQLALLEARLKFAAENGCDIAMMVAAPGSASQRNAERQGFRVAYTRTKWSG